MPSGVGSAIGFAAAIAAAVVAVALGAHQQPLIGLALFSGTTAIVAAVTPLPGAFGAAAHSWAFWDGFVVNRFGELAATPAEIEGLLVLAVTAFIVRSCVVAVGSLDDQDVIPAR
ncbi:MAG: hypothetical protein L0I76_22360 [Pseudonocardia sp.]|nr:hypothetical protein [Pseudonocardia sp.]